MGIRCVVPRSPEFQPTVTGAPHDTSWTLKGSTKDPAGKCPSVDPFRAYALTLLISEQVLSNGLVVIRNGIVVAWQHSGWPYSVVTPSYPPAHKIAGIAPG